MCSPSAPKQEKDDSANDELRILLSRDQYDKRGTAGTRLGPGGGYGGGPGNGGSITQSGGLLSLNGGLTIGK